MLQLPKGYLSHSSMELWRKNPDSFRRKYYENMFEPVSPEMKFGKHIATLLENHDELMQHVPQYSHPEYPLEFTIEGVPIKGYIDSFDPKKRRFSEFKTGKTPWDAVRVRKHPQLTLYSLGIQEVLGSVQDTCSLIWLETVRVDKPGMGLVTHEECYGIELTGRMEIFKRKIEQWERDRLREEIVQIAEEISRDYEAYKNRPRKGSLGLR